MSKGIYMKKIIVFYLALVLVFSIAGCSSSKYDENLMIGKTSAEIVAEFGEFDCTEISASADGLYRNGKCGYTIKESKPGFFGKTEEVLFFIHFDDNGVARECSEGYRPGG